MKGKIPLLITIVVVLFLLLASLLKSNLSKPSDDTFLAPSRNWPSEKKVEDYFVEKLRMTEKDLEMYKDRIAEGDKISFYVTETSALDGIVSNLEYYGFVRDKEALKYALANTKDTTHDKEDAIKVGSNGTIDINAYYELSEDMSAWEIANTLLNKPTYIGPHGDYGYLFMP